MRRAANIDANQPGIVDDLRERGVSVQVLAAVGKGCPDLLVGHLGRNYLLEVKNPDKLQGNRAELTPDQQTWHARWTGQVAVIHSTAEALVALGMQEET